MSYELRVTSSASLNNDDAVKLEGQHEILIIYIQIR